MTTLIDSGKDLLVCLFLTSLQQRGHLLSLAMDMKLGKYTVPDGNRTSGRRVAVHYATAAPRKLHFSGIATI